MISKSLLALSALTLACVGARAQTALLGPMQVPPLDHKVHIRIALNSANFFPLPIVYAQQKGYFAHANLDIEIVKYSQAAVALAPMLARGDLDIAPQTPSPSLFNLVAQGFGAKAIASFQSSVPGRTEGAWLLKSGDRATEIKEFSDLKGKTVEISQDGSTTNFMALLAIKDAGLMPGKDVTVRTSNHGNADYLTLVRNKAQDVIGITEPTATEFDLQGYAKRWESLSDVAPWFQSIVMTSSDKFLKENGPALRAFLEVYLATVREINATNGDWTDELMKTMTAWSGISPDVVRAMGGVPYFDENGRVSADSLDRTQAFWLERGTLRKQVSINDMIDPSPVNDALHVIGEKK